MKSKTYLTQTVIFSLLFSLAYLAIVLTLTGNWQKPVLQDDIPDLTIFVISVTAFTIVRGTHDRSGKTLVLLGLLLNAFVRLMRVPMGELYVHGMVFDPLYWNVIWIIYFLAVLLLLVGIKKMYG